MTRRYRVRPQAVPTDLAPWHTVLKVAFLVAVLVLAACGGDGGDKAADDATTPGADSDIVEDSDAGDAVTLHVRPEVHSLSAEQVDAYRQGVALMQTRAEDDPTSWLYQANIHGVPASSGDDCPASGAAQPAWATCQHGQFFFLSWHRMYLYFFERILRDAVQEATGDPDADFSLPYWDYETSSFAALPEAFRVPADASNSLFVAERTAQCNNGSTCVDAATGSATTALSLVPICNCPSGDPSCDGCTPNLFPDQTFGGEFVSAPVHFFSRYGELESQPHNVVHMAIGGFFGGWMANPNCAARDPIFWVHHANIDRLWQVWLNQGGGRVNALDSTTWKDTTFTFFDVGGVERTFTACEILNMATQLDYEYAGVPVHNVVLCDDEAPPATTPGGTPEEVVTMAEEERNVSLGTATTRVAVEVAQEAARTMVGLAQDDDPLRVVIEGLNLVRPGAYYQVYMNLPQGTEPDPKGPYYLGNLALFAHPGGHPGDAHADTLSTRSFDISDNVRQLEERGEWSGEVEISFVLGNPQEPPPGATVRTAPETFLTFNSISLIRRGDG